jgi:hypothetical protein
MFGRGRAPADRELMRTMSERADGKLRGFLADKGLAT